MNRLQFQQLSAERVRDAEVLLRAGRWSGAYYLTGYAVECALKACIAKLTKRHEFPDKERVFKSYTHKIESLVEEAGFKSERNTDAAARQPLAHNWSVVKEWDEKSRYLRWDKTAATKLFVAVTDPADGVLSWITVRW